MPVVLSQSIEVFLLVEQPRQRLGHWTQALAALDSEEAPTAAAIHAYYDPTCDQALVELRYNTAMLPANAISYVVDVAILAEVGMVQPAELSEGERVRFLSDRLARCRVEATYQLSVAGALTELVKRIKEQRTPRTSPPPPPMPTRTTSPAALAKGTRDDLTAQASSATSRHIIARATRQSTVQMPADEALELASRPDEDRRPQFGRLPSQIPAQPLASGDMIYARYLRGGRWVPMRIGALNLKRAAMMTGALPRLHDHVDVALSYGSHRALVRGAVEKVSTVREAAASGAASFTIEFELDEAAKRQLVDLLKAARAANVTIKPPPARATRRFPVDWPVALGAVRGAIKTCALDISTGGMFVSSTEPLAPDAVLNFAMPLDDTNGPVTGRARVVREIDEAVAQSCGIPAGFGLGIVEMTEADRMRWLAFLARVERRAEKRVLVGASPERLAELQTALAGCGYVVSGGSDPGALLQLARSDDRPADAALLDAGWLANGAASSWVESLFSARNVPFVTLQGDARRARLAVDRLLDVVI